MTQLTISIDRQSKAFAVFNGFETVRPFEKFTDEVEALRIAREYVAERSTEEPEIVYPVIRGMKITNRRK
jgi:hypothetical protein